mmetsp:Transcript_16743/g.34504  ORF Transcript_16743/g.34504 Transcript_16743/m.34504 type:complete len:389 (+) Transcript_16743:233-1399(+)
MASTSEGDHNETVNLLDLSAACISSAVVAADQITALASISKDEDDGENGNKKNARLKIDGSFVTDADMAAQQIIVDALNKVSSGIRIVGEENEEEMRKRAITGHEEKLEAISRLALEEILIRYDREQQQTQVDNDCDLPLSQQRKFDEDSTNAASIRSSEMEDFHIDTKRVSVFIDPLDATNSYAKGDHDPVSILVAIILDQTPCFGVICKPFGHPEQTPVLDTGCMTVYGGTLLGGAYIAGGAAIRRTKDVTDDARAVISQSRSKGIVQDFVSYLGEKGIIHPEPLHVSGAGEKSLRIITGFQNEGLWFYPKGGTSLWDVAASDALLRATGGRLTDKYGNDMDYSKSQKEAENKKGVIACYDKGLHAECIRLFLDGSWEDKAVSEGE